MNIQHKTSLSALTTMGLGGDAAQLVEVYSPDDVRQAVAYARQHALPWYVLGGGSNTLARDDGFDGLVILNKIPGINVIDQTKQYTTFTVGAGELWDAFVAQTVDRNLSGIECLSAIPGTVGAGRCKILAHTGKKLPRLLLTLTRMIQKTTRLRGCKTRSANSHTAIVFFAGASKDAILSRQ